MRRARSPISVALLSGADPGISHRSPRHRPRRRPAARAGSTQHPTAASTLDLDAARTAGLLEHLLALWRRVVLARDPDGLEVRQVGRRPAEQLGDAAQALVTNLVVEKVEELEPRQCGGADVLAKRRHALGADRVGGKRKVLQSVAEREPGSGEGTDLIGPPLAARVNEPRGADDHALHRLLVQREHQPVVGAVGEALGLEQELQRGGRERHSTLKERIHTNADVNQLRPARRRNCLADGGDVVLKRGPAALMIRGGAGRVDLGIVRDKEASGQLVRVPNLHPGESSAQGLVLRLRHRLLSLHPGRLVEGAVVEEDGHARREGLPSVRTLGDLEGLCGCDGVGQEHERPSVRVWMADTLPRVRDGQHCHRKPGISRPTRQILDLLGSVECAGLELLELLPPWQHQLPPPLGRRRRAQLSRARDDPVGAQQAHGRHQPQAGLSGQLLVNGVRVGVHGGRIGQGLPPDAARARDTIHDERDGRLRRGESRLRLRLRRSSSRSRQPHLILSGGTCAGGVGHLCRPLRRLR
mmetsp:Transcript_18153/g.57457  ORF Transcript_18153/g.57457 Transcript_18153/m.57457 type:complete len:527 (+) Transcript_18153:359-1939(+)